MKSLMIRYSLILIYCALAQEIDVQDEVSNNVTPSPSEDTGTSSTVTADGVTSDQDSPTGLINWISSGSSSLKNKLSLGTETLNKAINIGNTSMHMAASMGSSVASQGTDYLKQGVKTATSLGLRGIDNSVELAHQILELLEGMPGIGVISEVGKNGVSMAGNFGKNTLNGISRLKNMKLNLINNLAQRGSDALTNIANTSSGIGQTIISSGSNALKDGIDTGAGVINRVVTGFERLRVLAKRLRDTLSSTGGNIVARRNIIQTPPRQ